MKDKKKSTKPKPVYVGGKKVTFKNKKEVKAFFNILFIQLEERIKKLEASFINRILPPK